jgi:PAS domain S-box-containing protein
MTISDRRSADEPEIQVQERIAELEKAKQALRTEIQNANILHTLSTRYIEGSDSYLIYQEIVDSAIAITKADKGNIQLLDESTGTLKIVAHRGFDVPFLKFFEFVDAEEAAACGTAMKRMERVVIEDVTQSSIFVGSDALKVLLNEGVLGVQSTPLVSRSGKLLGIISTHFSHICTLSEHELMLSDILARQAADIIEHEQGKHTHRYNRILEGSNRIFSIVVQSKTEEELGNECLSVALEITGSPIGFVDLMGDDGLLHDVAISDMGWKQCLMYDKTGHRRPPENLVVHGLYGSVINSEKSFFTNDPQLHPDSIGLPYGHPPLASFLGVPLVLDGKIKGLLAVANREGGYSCEQQKDLEAITPAIMEALHRKKSEGDLLEAYEKLQVQSEELQAQAEEVQVQNEELQTQFEDIQAQNEELQVQSEELRKAYETLQEGEKRFRRLVNQAPIPLCFVNKDGILIYFNERFVKTFGYTHEDVPTLEEWWELAYPNGNYRSWVVATWETAVQHAVQEQIDIQPIEYNVTCKDGTVRIVEISGITIEDNFLATFIDLTDRKRAEEMRIEHEALRKVAEAIKAERQRLFDVLEALPAMICLLTSDYHVAFANRSYREHFGVAGERCCYEYRFGFTSRCEFCESYKVLETGQSQHWESIDPDGRIIETYDLPFTDVDGSPMILKMDIDVTEHKKAEEKIRLSNIYNRSLIEAGLDPLVTIGPDGKITDVNSATERVTGYLRDELVGTNFIKYFTEPEKAKKGYQEVFKEGSVFDYELAIQDKKGHITPVLYNASVYKDESGTVIGVFDAARNITELKNAEKILKLKLEELIHSNEELEQFAYVSSHDLQEPLRMITSYLQLLQRKYQGRLDEKADKYINFAVDGAFRMQNLINDLLEYSRVGTGNYGPESIDCEFILNKVLSNLKMIIKENNVIISHSPLPEVVADSTQIMQIFQNLIFNGIKFHSEQAPKIHIAAEK